jgi:hypothetical protein
MSENLNQITQLKNINDLTEDELLFNITNLIKQSKENKENKKNKKTNITKILKTISNSIDSSIMKTEEEQINKLYDITDKIVLNKENIDKEKLIVSNLFSLIQNPFPLAYNKVIAKESALHGFGVFATDTIPANTIVTFYPAHAIIIRNEKSQMDSNNNLSALYYYNNIQFAHDNDYKISFIKKIILSANPDYKSNPLLIGHILNDSQCIMLDDLIKNKMIELNYELSDNKSLETFIENNDISDIEKKVKNSVCKYILQSSNNCVFVTNDYGLLYIKTTKEIKKDEELLVSYGPIYWLRNSLNLVYAKLYKNDEKFKQFIDKYNYNY